ncbi:MAG: MEDS domain-containing protein [Candidatus Bathyarchaeota archaeon]|nr:MEDS domain-containing protein [Candidatus Bathyarchaeota archaeon]
MFLGEHTFCFYNSVNQKHCILLSNLVYGIKSGCSALYIASEESVGAVKAELDNFGLKSDDPQKLKIVTSHEWYTPDGDFIEKRVKDQYRHLIDNAIDSGFAGLYVSADASNTFDYLSKKGMTKAWMDYENSLGATFKLPMEAICAYRVEQIKSNGQMLLQLVKSHKYTISPNTEKRILNDQLIRSTVFHQFKGIQRARVTTLISESLDNYVLTQNLGTPNNVVFWNLIETILEEDSHLFANIEHNIMKEIFARIDV